MSPQPTRHAEGLRRHLQADLQEADHAAVPGVQAAGLSALPRPAPALDARERAGEVRRLLALRRRVPGRLHPRRRRREHARQPRLGRRALRAHLRDQPQPLHLLRLLRARVPVRRDHARQRVRDLGAQPRRPDLHEGHAARAAGEAGARSPTATSTTRRSPSTRATRERARRRIGRERARLDRLGRRRLRVPRLGRRGRLVLEPVLLGARADREPRLARRPVPAAVGGVRRGRAGARLRGRGDGDVPVRDRVRRAAARDAVGRRPELADGRRGARRRRAARRDRRRDRPEGERRARRTTSTSDANFGTPAWIGRALPHRPPARVRDHLDRAAHRGGRRRDPRLAHDARRSRGVRPDERPEHRLVPRASPPFLFGIGALGVLIRRNPLDRAALARADAERRQPRADRVLAPLRTTARARSSRSP